MNANSASLGYRMCVLTHPSGEMGPTPLALLSGDDYVAAARGDRVHLYRFDELPSEGERAVELAVFRTRAQVQHLDTFPGAGPLVAVAALADRSVWAIGFANRLEHYRPSGHALADDLGGEVRSLFCMGRAVLALVDDADAAGPLLVEIGESAGATRRARLPLANITAVRPLDPDRGDLLVVLDARHGAHVVGFTPDQDGASLTMAAFDPDLRVTAAIVWDERWTVLCRKGGEVIKARRPTSDADRDDAAAHACRRLRPAPKDRGAGCSGGATPEPSSAPPCRCEDGNGGKGRPTGGTGETTGPGSPRPGTTVLDDEPCEEKHRAHLGWTVGVIHRVGEFLAAVSLRGDRMAVLDANLTVVAERYLGRRGCLVATGSRSTDRMLVQRRGRPGLEAWSLADYVRGVRVLPELPGGPLRPNRAAARTVTFRGRPSPPSAPNPHLRVAVFTVTEPGQVFSDPDQARMQALLQPNVYDVVRDYYRENSFDTVETDLDVFGVHIGTSRAPLVLPRPIASYFRDRFTSGGVEAIMPGDWANPVVLDGTEAMTLRTDPAVGVGKDYTVPFAALWTSATHSFYPVAASFIGTETLQLDIEDQAGTAHTLALTFGPLTVSHVQGDDEGAFLATIGQHITAAVRAAETAAGLPTLVQDVVFRRIRTSPDDTQFGRLQGQVRTAAVPGAVRKGRVSISVPGGVSAPLGALGLSPGSGAHGVLDSSADIAAYLTECVHAARFDVGEGVGLSDPQIDAAVETEENVVSRTVRARISFTTERGGAGAEISVPTGSGLAASGWAGAVPVPGSASTANNQNTMRDHQQLADDVFTAAMDHIRATGPWDPTAVRSQFAGFDAMMIGFVGSCPTTVPVAQRWTSANPLDFARLRMFVRYHQATDLHNPDPSEPPVTMGTDLLIGQRFDRFDPGVMSHEIGHGLGLPDLYSATGFRDDVAYVDRWCQMAGGNNRFNHFCAWSKWAVGWIVESPDPVLNRVVDVPMPAPSGTTVTEAWLVPVEYWDGGMRADVVAAVGSGLPIGQMMKVHLGSDGGVVDLIELRARGRSFSQQLPPTPAVVVTNVLQPGTDRRWAVNGLYRREVHLLNGGRELAVVGDRWDFADGDEFPLKGCRIEVLDMRTIRGGTVPLCRLRVQREPAEFVDLHFQDNVPSWRSPDVWVDWRGDNPDPAVARIYPEGTPTDQGEVVRFPSSGSEPHFIVTRPHNAGNVRVEDVKVRWFICDPPGAGDDGRWVQRDTRTLSQIPADSWVTLPFDWAVDPATNDHQCLRAEIIDWTIPAGVDPATGDTLALSSDDVLLQNNNAQKNVFDFEAAT